MKRAKSQLWEDNKQTGKVEGRCRAVIIKKKPGEDTHESGRQWAIVVQACGASSLG